MSLDNGLIINLKDFTVSEYNASSGEIIKSTKAKSLKEAVKIAKNEQDNTEYKTIFKGEI